MLNQLLKSFKLCPSCDIISTIVKFTNLIMFDMISFHIIPVSNRQGIGTCLKQKRNKKLLAAFRYKDFGLLGSCYKVKEKLPPKNAYCTLKKNK